MFFKEADYNSEKLKAIELFQEAYSAQMSGDLDAAIRYYKRSIDVYPTAEAFTFLGWTYSFKGDYDLAIAECLAAISVDATFGNPYNDIGSYLVAKGNFYDCVRWFNLAIQAPRYEARAYPHFNLGHVYEKRGNLMLAAKHYGLAFEESPNYKSAEIALRTIQGKLN
jgi:tetratricopeptide (TPR) repeat protein